MSESEIVKAAFEDGGAPEVANVPEVQVKEPEPFVAPHSWPAATADVFTREAAAFGMGPVGLRTIVTRPSRPFRFHSLGLPHTVSSSLYNACAFTQKVVKFSRMMLHRGHTIYHYGHEESDLPCTEHITVTDNETLEKAYGGYDWKRHLFRHGVDDHAHKEFVRRAIPEIRARAQRGDYLLCWWGYGHKAIADAVGDLGIIIVEPGIGYPPGSCFSEWRIYESFAVRNAIEGDRNPQRWYCPVIPNYFDPAEFKYSAEKEPWILFMGRVGEAKGVTVCIQAAKAAGVKLKIAGQQRLVDSGYKEVPDHVEEIGYADLETRKELMSRASALIIASCYNEPFGGVQVEALLSGTPVISPFYGAFSEVNVHGVTGFHCATLRDFRDAILVRHTINPAACRARGMQYCLDAVAPMYERYFDDLSLVFNGKRGWMELGEDLYEAKA
jgi:glycosyltransferase involved in cell wall biosynthesis